MSFPLLLIIELMEYHASGFTLIQTIQYLSSIRRPLYNGVLVFCVGMYMAIFAMCAILRS